jgi:hypothetical protein
VVDVGALSVGLLELAGADEPRAGFEELTSSARGDAVSRYDGVLPFALRRAAAAVLLTSPRFAMILVYLPGQFARQRVVMYWSAESWISA